MLGLEQRAGLAHDQAEQRVQLELAAERLDGAAQALALDQEPTGVGGGGGKGHGA